MSRTILTDHLAALLNRLADEIKKLQEEPRVPAGALIGWPRQVSADANLNDLAPFRPPEGWLVCDGTAVDRLNYSRLFAEIETDFGVGDGVNTFNLPDYGNTLNSDRYYVLIKT